MSKFSDFSAALEALCKEHKVHIDSGEDLRVWDLLAEGQPMAAPTPIGVDLRDHTREGLVARRAAAAAQQKFFLAERQRHERLWEEKNRLPRKDT